MKILYIVHSFPPFHWRGTEVYALELAAAMAESHEVSVFYLRPDPAAETVTLEEDSFRGLSVRRARLRLDPALPETYFFNPELEPAFREILNRIAPEVVHFLYFTGGLSLNMPRISAETGKKVVLTVTDFSGLCPRGQRLDAEGRSCSGPREGLRCVHCLFGRNLWVKSPGLDRFLREHVPPALVGAGKLPELGLLRRRGAAVREAFAAAKTVIYPNRNAQTKYHAAGIKGRSERVMDYGIDTAPFAHHRKSKADAVRIGFVGQLLPHKGLRVLAQAVTTLPGNWRLKIFGSLEDPGAREYFDSLKLDPLRVEFRGTFPFERMNAVLEEIDVLVVPSQWDENCPLIVKYAIATGTPTALADQPGMVADRRGLDHVRFFFPADPVALRKCLEELMKEVQLKTDAVKESGNADLMRALKSGALIEVKDQAKDLQKIYREGWIEAK